MATVLTGLVNMSHDLGRELKPVSAPWRCVCSMRHIGHRRGAGRVRHMETATFLASKAYHFWVHVVKRIPCRSTCNFPQ
eukprot:423022-Amphidinium_carterae.1